MRGDTTIAAGRGQPAATGAIDQAPPCYAAAPMPPLAGALLAVVFWGISFVATKAALAQVSPITLIFTRFAIGCAVLVALLGWRGRQLRPPRDAWPMLVAMGFVGIFVHQLLQSNGLVLTSAAKTGWLIGLTPIWSALLSAVMLGERFGPAKLGGLVLGFAGAALVVTRGRLDAGLLRLPDARGDLLILASTLNWAFYSVLGHPTLKRLGTARATAGSMVLGWLMLAPLYVRAAGWREYGRLSAGGWLAVLFLGVACSALGYLFWYRALERLEASRVASLLYLEPLVTLAAAVLLLGEPVHATTLLGGVMVLGGVVLVQAAPVTAEAGEA
jgi:drug/metabolite transporter (DMT)-like permease